MHQERNLHIGLLSLLFLLVSFGSAAAEIGFKHKPAWERLVDPTRNLPRYGLVSTVWDSIPPDSLKSKSVQAIPAEADTAGSVSPIPAKEEKLPQAEIEKPGPASQTLLGTTPSETIPEKAEPPVLEKEPTTGSGIAPFDPLKKEKPSPTAEQEIIVTDTTRKKPLPYHPTIVMFVDYPIDFSAELDTSTDYVVLSHSLAGDDFNVSGAMTRDAYLERMIAYSDRESWRNSILNKMPKETSSEGGAIEISIPVFKGKWAQRVFGGNEVGLSVTGDITVDGGLRTEKRTETSLDNPNPTSYNFRVDQTQRFHIKGSVGEKVSVEIDQDSQALFELENNLRVTYTGNEDEIIQKMEAGNVNLSLPGTKFVSGSARHQGLFGLKTESKIGGLKLITIASLDKGEKQSKKIEGGAESSGDIRIDPTRFIKNKFFFLDKLYRDYYKHRDPTNLASIAVPDAHRITNFEVYKSVRGGGENPNAVAGWALYNPFEEWSNDNEPDREHLHASFLRLESDADYFLDTQLGFIRMNRALEKGEILAIAYTSASGVVYGQMAPPADPEATPFILKLLKTDNPQPNDSTWTLMWRHVYDLGATGIQWEGFEGRIERDIVEEATQSKDSYQFPGGENKTYIHLFGLDFSSAGGGGFQPDDQIDAVFVDRSLGMLEFPDLRPFDPGGWFRGINQDTVWNELRNSEEALFNPEIYDGSESGLTQINSQFTIIVSYKNVSATYDLGFMVLEGSEEVILNGQRLNRGSDYTIDYMSGNLTILKREALSPDANLEIKYETGQLMQLDTKTVLGLRAEYELWENSHIGTTLMYRSEKTADQRIRIGQEPLRNSIWDINASLTFKPHFLTAAADWLPLIETDNPSTFKIEGEIAQVYPNPNSLNSPSTGDNNGVAFVDDFESVKRSIPLGITRTLWSAASFPKYDSRGIGSWQKQRGRLIWYNPHQQENIKDIWPKRESQAQDSKTNVLKIEFQPWWDEWGATQTPGIIPEQSWGGVMRYLGAGFADQSQSKYIEIWLNRGSATSGIMYIDLGEISEDVIPNGKLDTEDRATESLVFGNSILDKEEDTGIDTEAMGDPGDLVDINGDGVMLPSYDDYYYDYRNNPDDYSHINGTEGNRNDEGGHYPDTEDLDGGNFLDLINNFFRYKIDLSDGDNNKYIAGGLNNPEDKGWRLYRIPLTDTVTVGKPSITSVEYVRIWFAEFRRPAAVRIAQFEIVGNEWREVSEGGRDSNIEPVKIAVINTHDNPEYSPPPGVSGEIDPVTNLRAKEQSLVVRIDKLKTGEIGRIHKHLYKSIDLLDYSYLKLFVHGGDTTGRLTDRFGRELDLEMFFRFGSDTSRNYYEYSQRLQSGWHEDNQIIINLERISSLKFLREQDSLRNYDILPSGDVIRVVGNPSLGKISDMIIGLKNHGRDISESDGVEVWVDEMRVSDVHRDPGWAARGSMSLEIADLMSVSADLTQKDANFHNVDSKRSPVSNKESLSGRMNAKLNVDKVLNPQWGVRIPITGQFTQGIEVPKYKPNSDVRLSSLGGKQVKIYTIFSENITSNQRVSDNPVYTSPTDSLIDLRKNYSFSTSYSKSKRSLNPFIKYSLDRLSLSFTHQESYSSDHNTLYKKGRQNKANGSYEFSFDEPLEIRWLGWASSIPILGKLSESTFKPLPSSLNLNVSGTESYDITKSRAGRVNIRDPFGVDRGLSTNWQPFEIFSMSFRQQINSDRVREEGRRDTIALMQTEPIMLSDYYLDPLDPSAGYDTVAYEDALEESVKEAELIKKDLFWSVFGENFIDNSLSQNFSTSIRPQLLSWLATDGNYNAIYRWNWSDQYGPGDRQVSVNSTFTTSLTLRVPQLVSGWNDKPGREKTPTPGGNEDIGDPYDMGRDFDPYGEEQPPPDNQVPEADKKIDAGKPEADSTKQIEKPAPDLLAPVKFVLKRLRDVRWQYTLTNDTRNSSVGPGQAAWDYRLGFSRIPNLSKVEGYVSRDSRGRRDQHTFASGFDVTRTFRIGNISYDFSSSKTSSYSLLTNGTDTRTMWHHFDGTEIKKYPAVNWSASWSGLSEIEFLKKFTSSISVENAFRGNEIETWEKTSHPDSSKITNRFEYEKGFSPLLGLSINWRGGITSNARYNNTQRVTDERRGGKTKSRSNSESINLTASYTANKGFSIPIPVWPFKNRHFKNRTTFSFGFTSSKEKQETSREDNPFAETNSSSSWSASPSIEYSFSTTVRGGFEYEYSTRKSSRGVGKVTSQDFKFRVNISIRG